MTSSGVQFISTYPDHSPWFLRLPPFRIAYAHSNASQEILPAWLKVKRYYRIKLTFPLSESSLAKLLELVAASVAHASHWHIYRSNLQAQVSPCGIFCSKTKCFRRFTIGASLSALRLLPTQRYSVQHVGPLLPFLTDQISQLVISCSSGPTKTYGCCSLRILSLDDSTAILR